MLKYESLNQLVEFQGCTALSIIRLTKNAKYTHSSIVDEFQECIVQAIHEVIVAELNKINYLSSELLLMKLLTYLYAKH